MTTASVTMAAPRTRAAYGVLTSAAALWWSMAILGQWVFLYYIATFYGGSTLQGNFAAWTKNHMLLKGYVPGDTAGNLTFAAHALLAAVIAFGGAVQLIPWIRTHAIGIHRWNGRLFLATALAVSVTGLYMIWVRHATTGGINAIGISLNGALIILFAALAWRAVRARSIDSHRRWALRTFMVANGQWFFRVGLFAWIIVNRGPVGIGKHFDGPFIVFWNFGCYLMPLAVLEVYLRAKDLAGPRAQYAVAGGLVVLTVLMGMGIFGAYMFIWRPILALI